MSHGNENLVLNLNAAALDGHNGAAHHGSISLLIAFPVTITKIFSFLCKTVKLLSTDHRM